VVEAGVELGLEKLSLSAVALRLGVSVAAIYTYVANRDELVRLVAAALAQQPPIADRGQHWSEIVRDHAARDFTLLRDEPVLLAHVVSGAIEPDEGFAQLEHFIALLVVRDFTPEAALALHHATGEIAVGAAVRAAMGHAWAARGVSRRDHIARSLAKNPDAFPQLRRIAATLADDAHYFDYRPTLERLLAHVATERGEVLPTAITTPDERLTL
jgi:AcrR family transcriptional regulator